MLTTGTSTALHSGCTQPECSAVLVPVVDVCYGVRRGSRLGEENVIKHKGGATVLSNPVIVNCGTSDVFFFFFFCKSLALTRHVPCRLSFLFFSFLFFSNSLFFLARLLVSPRVRVVQQCNSRRKHCLPTQGCHIGTLSFSRLVFPLCAYTSTHSSSPTRPRVQYKQHTVAPMYIRRISCSKRSRPLLHSPALSMSPVTNRGCGCT